MKNENNLKKKNIYIHIEFLSRELSSQILLSIFSKENSRKSIFYRKVKENDISW